MQNLVPELAYFHPEIPGNTGAAIRLCAVTGSKLHLIKPLGFLLSESKLKRAGLDYHDLTAVELHENFDDFVSHINSRERRILAFTTTAKEYYNDFEFKKTDVLLFGPESVGLPKDIVENEAIYKQLRIPMKPALRSLNLTNSASIVLYEAWRQMGFAGAV
jgi:tRNA (cytidine/uridine-2'-O-)-methyltransferase